jgi:hypothetical protein
LEVKQPAREAEHSTPSSTEVKNAWGLPPHLQFVFVGWCSVKHRIRARGVVLVKHEDNSTKGKKNRAPHHEGVLGNGCIASFIL